MEGLLLGSGDLTAVEELIPDKLKGLLTKIKETLPGDRFMIDAGAITSPEGEHFSGFSIFPTDIESVPDGFVARVCIACSETDRIVLIESGSGKTTTAMLANKNKSEEEIDDKTLSVVHDCLIPQEIRS